MRRCRIGAPGRFLFLPWRHFASVANLWVVCCAVPSACRGWRTSELSRPLSGMEPQAGGMLYLKLLPRLLHFSGILAGSALNMPRPALPLAAQPGQHEHIAWTSHELAWKLMKHSRSLRRLYMSTSVGAQHTVRALTHYLHPNSAG